MEIIQENRKTFSAYDIHSYKYWQLISIKAHHSTVSLPFPTAQTSMENPVDHKQKYS